jgi:hypothetical protein
MSSEEYILNVSDESVSFTSLINNASLLAITVPVTFSSAISLARFGPLNTPILFLALKALN